MALKGASFARKELAIFLGISGRNMDNAYGLLSSMAIRPLDHENSCGRFTASLCSRCRDGHPSDPNFV
jgi:hypothetical protein